MFSLKASTIAAIAAVQSFRIVQVAEKLATNASRAGSEPDEVLNSAVLLMLDPEGPRDILHAIDLAANHTRRSRAYFAKAEESGKLSREDSEVMADALGRCDAEPMAELPKCTPKRMLPVLNFLAEVEHDNLQAGARAELLAIVSGLGVDHCKTLIRTTRNWLERQSHLPETNDAAFKGDTSREKLTPKLIRRYQARYGATQFAD